MSDTATRRLAVPDLISPSYFPAIAAVELGCAAERGLDVDLVLHFPVTDAVERLRAGEFDYVAGAAHSLFHNAHDGGGVRLLATLSRNMYWFLVVRSDLGLKRGDDLHRLSGLKLGAAPGPDAGLIEMLSEAGLKPGDVNIGPVPGTSASSVSFGVTAAEALAAGRLDGFWANGMGAEVAVRDGVGTVMVDARRGDGPPDALSYTFASLMCTNSTLEQRPAEVDGVITGLLDAQRRLRGDATLATGIGERLFPPMEASLIATLIERDAPFYEPVITRGDVTSLVAFAGRRGLTTLPVDYRELVPEQAERRWQALPE